MPLSVNFDGLELNSQRYQIDDPSTGVDWGTQEVASALLTGQYRLEELDQVAASMGLTRTVRLGLQVRSPSSDAMMTDQQALWSRLAAANRYAPKTLTVTPSGSTHVSTFRVFGGTWTANHDYLAERNNLVRGTLELVCDWPVRGASQSLGSSGSPLVSNAASPANVTLTPSPTGDVPGDVTLFVKNRHATLPIRSAFIAGISSNTTWTTLLDAPSGWTLDAVGTSGGSILTGTTTLTGTVQGVGHAAAPTLPSDRRFRVYIKVRDTAASVSNIQSYRVRLVSGQAEVIGPWRTMPAELVGGSGTYYLPDMGAYTFPVGSFGDLGAQGTTIYIEQYAATGTAVVNYDYVLFLPDESTLLVETSDTSKTLAAAAGVVRVESDQAYDASGNAAGGAMIGSHIRTLGGRYVVHTSQGYAGTVDSTLPFAPENVDVWATFVPRFVGLA